PTPRAERGLNRQEAAPETPALGGDPVEHGNIDVIEACGQPRRRPAWLRHDDLRTADHRGEPFDGRVVQVVAKLHRRLRPASPTTGEAGGSIECAPPSGGSRE